MSGEATGKSYEWADQFFRSDYEVAPKYRDILAMLAATMMGNPGAAQHFYDQALVDGASDAELDRVVEISRTAGIEIGGLFANVKRAVEEMHSENQLADEAASQDSQSGVN